MSVGAEPSKRAEEVPDIEKVLRNATGLRFMTTLLLAGAIATAVGGVCGSVPPFLTGAAHGRHDIAAVDPCR